MKTVMGGAGSGQYAIQQETHDRRQPNRSGKQNANAKGRDESVKRCFKTHLRSSSQHACECFRSAGVEFVVEQKVATAKGRCENATNMWLHAERATAERKREREREIEGCRGSLMKQCVW